MSAPKKHVIQLNSSQPASVERPVIFSFNGTGQTNLQQNEYESLFNKLGDNQNRPVVVYFKGCDDKDVGGFNPLAAAFPHLSKSAKRITKAFRTIGKRTQKNVIDLCALKREFGAGIEITPSSLSDEVNHLLAEKGKRAVLLISPKDNILRLEGYSRGATLLYRLAQFLKKQGKTLKLRLFAHEHVPGNSKYGYGTLKNKVKSLDDNVEKSYSLRGTYTKIASLYGKVHGAFFNQQLPSMHPNTNSKSISIPLPSHHFDSFLGYHYMRYALAEDFLHNEYKSEYDENAYKNYEASRAQLKKEDYALKSLEAAKINDQSELERLKEEYRSLPHPSEINYYHLPTKTHLGESDTLNEFINKHSDKKAALIKYENKFYFLVKMERKETDTAYDVVKIELNEANVDDSQFKPFKQQIERNEPSDRGKTFHFVDKEDLILIDLQKKWLKQAIDSKNPSPYQEQYKTYLDKINTFEKKELKIIEIDSKIKSYSELLERRTALEKKINDHLIEEKNYPLRGYKNEIIKEYKNNSNLFNLFINSKVPWFVKSYGQAQNDSPDPFFIEALDEYSLDLSVALSRATSALENDKKNNFSSDDPQKARLIQLREHLKKFENYIINKDSSLDLEAKKAIVNLIQINLYNPETKTSLHLEVKALPTLSEQLTFILNNTKESKQFVELINTRIQNLTLTRTFANPQKQYYLNTKNTEININTRQFIHNSYNYLSELSASTGFDKTLAHNKYVRSLRQNVSDLKKLGFDNKANRFLDYTVYYFLKNILGFPYNLYKFCKTRDLRTIFLPAKTSSEKSLDLGQAYLEKISHPEPLAQSANKGKNKSSATSPKNRSFSFSHQRHTLFSDNKAATRDSNGIKPKNAEKNSSDQNYGQLSLPATLNLSLLSAPD